MSDRLFALKSPSSNDIYNITERLDRGAFSVVWLANRNKEDKKVVIKIQHTDCFGSPTYMELPLRARREVFILENIRHENIICLHEHFIHQKSFVQILDSFPMNLDTFIKTRRSSLTMTRIRYILFQILSGLYALHSKEIVHRDMKPHNVVINPGDDDHVCLIDFGCARLLPSSSSMSSSYASTASSSASSLMDLANADSQRQDLERAFPFDVSGGEESVRETPLTPQVMNRPYRSPELLLGEKKYTCAIDIWAVGCTMYELLTGQTFVCENSDWKQLVGLFEKLGGPFDLDGVGHLDYFQFEEQPGLSKDKLFEDMDVRETSEEKWRDLMLLWDGLMTQNYVLRMPAQFALRLDVFMDF